MFLLQERAKDSQDAHFLLALVFFFLKAVSRISQEGQGVMPLLLLPLANTHSVFQVLC